MTGYAQDLEKLCTAAFSAQIDARTGVQRVHELKPIFPVLCLAAIGAVFAHFSPAKIFP